MLKKYYKDFFVQNYANKSAINDTTGIKIELVNSGLNHSLNQDKNYRLWPTIRYLSSIIKNAFHTIEPSLHTTDPNTTRGSVTHIFYSKGDYIFKSDMSEKKETHILKIIAVTFKQGNQNNFRHITKLDENQTIISTRLVSIEIE